MSVVRAKNSPWVERAGRAGLAAKGVLYGIVAVLAVQIPLGLGGATTDRQGALRTVASQPFGELLLSVLASGLFGYAVWRFVQAFLDRDDEGTGPKGLAKRAGYLGRGLLYLGSAAAAVSLIVGLGSGGSNEKEETARVLDWPFGRWIVGGVGAAFLAAGLFNAYRALTTKFREDLKEHQMGSTARPWAILVGVLGHAARGVVFALIGVFLVRAALQYDPREAIGINGALRKSRRARTARCCSGSSRPVCSRTRSSASFRLATARSESEPASPNAPSRRPSARAHAAVRARARAAGSVAAGKISRASAVLLLPRKESTVQQHPYISRDLAAARHAVFVREARSHQTA